MQKAWEYEKEGMGLQYNYGQQAADAEYKRNEYLKKGEAEAPKTAESQPEGGVTEPNPTRDN